MSDASVWGDILVAEDSSVNQRVTRAMLENLGYRVDTVDTGTAAVEAAAVKQYRAILMDCQLLELDGDLATTEIRRWRGASAATPIIAVTISEQRADELRCLSVGMNDCLTKPLTMKALAAVLSRWVHDELDLDAPAPEATGPDGPGTRTLEPPVLDGLAIDRLEQARRSPAPPTTG